MGTKRTHDEVTYEEDESAALCGRGVKKTAREKDFLLHLLKNIEHMVQSGGVNPFRGMSANDIWEGVTGMNRHTLTSIRRELQLNDSTLSHDKKPGPKVRKVEFEFDWFIEYLNGKVEGAKKGGYLTVNKLKVALQEECGVTFFFEKVDS